MPTAVKTRKKHENEEKRQTDRKKKKLKQKTKQKKKCLNAERREKKLKNSGKMRNKQKKECGEADTGRGNRKHGTLEIMLVCCFGEICNCLIFEMESWWREGNVWLDSRTACLSLVCWFVFVCVGVCALIWKSGVWICCTRSLDWLSFWFRWISSCCLRV